MTHGSRGHAPARAAPARDSSNGEIFCCAAARPLAGEACAMHLRTQEDAMQRTVERMLRTSPQPPFASADPLCACIHACVECAQVCTACADACVADHAP